LTISARLVLDRKWLVRPARVLRGGSWNNNDRDNLLSSNRNNNPADNRNDNIGFRLVLVGVPVRKVFQQRWRDVPWRTDSGVPVPRGTT